MFSKIYTKLKNFTIGDWLLILFLVNFVLITAAIMFYNGNFLFWQYPFSDAGTTYNYYGDLNTVSRYIYSLDMLLSSLIMLALFYQKRAAIWSANLLFLMASLGFLAAASSPDDTRHQFHVLGSALAIGSLWLLSNIYLFCLKKHLGLRRYYLLQIILQLPTLSYAFTFFANIDPLSYILQKFALGGLGIVLLYCVFQYSKVK